MPRANCCFFTAECVNVVLRDDANVYNEDNNLNMPQTLAKLFFFASLKIRKRGKTMSARRAADFSLASSTRFLSVGAFIIIATVTFSLVFGRSGSLSLFRVHSACCACLHPFISCTEFY